MNSPLDAALTGAPGHSTDAHRTDLIHTGMDRYILPAAIIWVLAGMEWLGVWREMPRMPWVFTILAVAASIYGVFGFLQLRRKARHLKLGRDGEREVAHRLSLLNVPGARIFHDVDAGGFNLDHVVICERGIFVIETKTWSKPHKKRPIITLRDGRVFKAGIPAIGDPVRQAANEAQWLCELLQRKTGRSFRCQPVLVIPGWKVEYMDAATKAISWVLNPKILPGWIEGNRERLKPEDVNLVADSLMVHMRERAAND